MRRSTWKAIGDPLLAATVQIEEVERPSPGPNEVLIKCVALSINPIDYKLMLGLLPAKGKCPRGWGTDIAGVVESVGEGVTAFKTGDEVFADAIGHGPMAEFCVVPVDMVALKPKNLNFQQAAGIPLVGLTALQGLRDQGSLKAGMRVCIFGGSGGVGTSAIQLAKALGAAYVATTSSNADLCKSVGADKVVDYRDNKDLAGSILEEGEERFDIVFDTVGGYKHWAAAQKMLRSSVGTYVTIVGDGGSVGSMIPGIMWRKLVSNFGRNNYKIYFTKSNSKDLDILRGFAEEGKLKPTMDSENGGEVYKFSDSGIKSMLEKLMSHRTKGKLIMKV
jgi:NADPH:quinone reductase-like Zn-dependent oxidoreductase